MIIVTVIMTTVISVMIVSIVVLASYFLFKYLGTVSGWNLAADVPVSARPTSTTCRATAAVYKTLGLQDHKAGLL